MPSDYGLIGLSMLVVGITTLLADSGLGSAVVTLRTLNSAQVAQVHVLSGLVGTILFLLCCALAWPIGLFFGRPELPPVIALMSVLVAIVGWQSIPDALLQKQLRFRLLAVRDAVQGIVGASCTIVLALQGFGYWALAAGPVTGATVSLIWTLLAQRPGMAVPRFRELRHAISFSSYTLSSRLVWYAYSNADFAIAGKTLTTASLGMYTLAWSLANVSVEKVATLVGRVTPSFFSAVQSDRLLLQRYFGTLTQVISLAAFPVATGLALTADDFVPAILGAQWQPAVGPLIPLSLYAGFRALMPILPMVLQVTGDLRFVLLNGILALVVMPLAFYIGSSWGATGIAYAWMLAYPIVAIPFYVRVFDRLSMNLMMYLAWVRPAFTCTVLMAVVVLALKATLPATWPIGVHLAVSIAAGALTYFAALAIFFQPTLAQLVRSVRGVPAPPSL